MGGELERDKKYVIKLLSVNRCFYWDIISEL